MVSEPLGTLEKVFEEFKSIHPVLSHTNNHKNIQRITNEMHQNPESMTNDGLACVKIATITE